MVIAGRIKHVFTPDTGGLILVDKPLGWTSFDVVKKIRGAMRSVVRRRNFKVGHAGTLDPLATGLLILAYGPFTKKLPEITGQEKVYTGTMTLGATTPSYDGETETVAGGEWRHLQEKHIREVMDRHIGEVMQRPPLYSAKRHEGERGYHLARGGASIEMPPVKVIISRLDLLDLLDGQLRFEVHVSKGTYIRSLAHDIGQELGCGAYLSTLRRTAIGTYQVEDALSPMEWAEHIAPLKER